MTHVITSDIHLGCQYFDPPLFVSFLEALPGGAELILAGDVLDRSCRVLPEDHRMALDRLVALSRERHVVWVRGNHDRGHVSSDRDNIDVVDTYAVGKQLIAAHGHHFDNIMPYQRWFIDLLHTVHAVRAMLGVDSIHVARYAKRFPFFYGVFRNHVARNAVQYARENGYGAVVCGHTHAAEDRTIDGIRYLNTGAWTEPVPHYVVTRDDSPMLQAWNGVGPIVPLEDPA